MTSPNAADVKQQPNPELLKKFEAERDAARADRLAAEAKIRRGEEKVRKADRELRTFQQDIDRQLCEMGALPKESCP